MLMQILESFSRPLKRRMEKWFDFILKHDMEPFINAWDPLNQSFFRFYYDINSSPVLYLLDEDKKIVAKRISYEQAGELIDRFTNEDNKTGSRP